MVSVLRILVRVFVALLVVALLVGGLEMIAAESGEVVVLRTTDAAGAPKETRLWVVEDGSHVWLRSGSEAAGWYQQLAAPPCPRSGRAAGRRPHQRPDAREVRLGRRLHRHALRPRRYDPDPPRPARRAIAGAGGRGAPAPLHSPRALFAVEGRRLYPRAAFEALQRSPPTPRS
jgi:hypothetical protein